MASAYDNLKRDESGDYPTTVLVSSEIVSEPLDDGERIVIVKLVETVDDVEMTSYCVKDLASNCWRTMDGFGSSGAWTQNNDMRGRWEKMNQAVSRINADSKKRIRAASKK